MKVVEDIIQLLLEKYEKGVPMLVAIGGAADLGKSYLSKSIVEALANLDLQAGHLPLDSFLTVRAIRKKMGISGYDIESLDLETILKTIVAWKQGLSISFRGYNHQTGLKSEGYNEIKNADILIMDGLFALHQQFQERIDLSIFIYTMEETLVELRHEADLSKRRYSMEYSKSISANEMNLYLKHIAPFKKRADVRLFLESKWDYKMEISD